MVGWARSAPREARVVDLPGRVVIPGLVVAHAHLRYTHLEGCLRRGIQFTTWIRRLLSAPPPPRGAALRGARRLRARGASVVGDHDTDGSGAAALRAAGLAGVAYREFLAFDPATASAIVQRLVRQHVRRPVRGARPGPRAGLAPHAPYTVSLEALVAAGRARAPLSIHVGETEEEDRWCREGAGPIEGLLRERGRRPAFPVPGRSPFSQVDAAGLLGPRTLLVHGNVLARRELRRATEAGAVAVHCPGTHAWFRRGATPVRGWVAAGLSFALGTDSLASNDDLDPFLEMARLRASDPWLPPDRILHAATVAPVAAMGLARGTGTLLPGSPADFVVLDLEPPRGASARLRSRALHEALMHRPTLVARWPSTAS